MLAIFNIVFPIFSLIFLGWICRKRHILSAGAASELNRFVIWLALPALLFDSMSRLKATDFANLRFIAVFAIGVAVVFLLTAWLRLRQKAAAPDVIIDSLGSSYANTGFIGIPLCYLAFGNEGLPPSVIAMVMTACLLFAVAIVMLESCLHARAGWMQTVAKVGRSLLRNPIMIAPVAGIIVALSGVSLPGSVQQFFKILGGAASPCALVSLGLFLAQPVRAGDGAPVWLLVAFKLLLQPAVTAVLAYWLLPLPRLWADSAVLLAALPIGTGPFMLAELYQREVTAMSRAILISTTLSLPTIAVILAWIAHH
ncbi:transporter permease [Herbaspirillum sp. GW103]|jgi:predicted permease|uniref:AEC family transporter n=1 Tax=unclassified Herbaspirillum TaxID=2624150 RepID=UPI00025E2F3A|nr:MULTISPECIES: AEC family transporter [unclassified Herbaspirillum]EIJ44703.1 transporter permease [Herbaspirillum sp. GW103]MCI1006889.1 AEC family transporter [Herbaspirillum sp. C7C8]NUT62679.1 AEC family transporter [Herbaspirillum sp. C9C3]